MNVSPVSSVSFAPKHQSGIDVVDNAWGGLYRGGSYLVYGRAASGRGLLTLTFAHTGANLSEPVLFVSPDRHKDLMIQAASIGFNLRDSYENGIVRLMRVPPLMNLQNMGDDGVAAALWDLVNLIRQHRPTRLIMNDFMPFVAFRSFDRFRNEFIQFLEQIDSLETTMMLVMPEPANEQSRRVIEFMASQMTGSMHIELADENTTTTKRRITLIPHIGHIKRQVVDYWDLEDLVQTSSDVSRETPVQPSAESRPTWQEEQAGYAPRPTTPQSTPQAYSAPHSTPVQPEPQAQMPAPVQPPSAPQVPVRSQGGSIFVPTSIPSPFQQAPPPQQQQPSPFQQAPPPQQQQPSPFQQAPPPQQPQPSPFQQAPPPQQQQPSPFQPAPPPQQQPSPFQPAPPPQQQQPSKAPIADPNAGYTNRPAFEQRLEGYFAARTADAEPFLLLALRMDRSEKKMARPFDFDFLMDLVREELRRGDDMLVNIDEERMVVLLSNSRADQAQRFFARLKDRLRKESPVQADHLLHSVSAIVVPDGQPFEKASEFLTYALDEA